MPGIGEDQRKFRLMAAVVSGEAAHADDFASAIGGFVLRDQRPLAVVVRETTAHQPVVRRARPERKLAEVTEMDRLLGKRAVERGGHSLILPRRPGAV